MSDMEKIILAVDGGGTFLKAALFRGMELIDGTFMSIPACSSGTAKEIAGAFRTLSREARAKADALHGAITAVGVGMPGPFDYLTGTLQMDHKFAAAKGMPVGPWLTESIGDVPVRFGHDAAVFFRGGVYLEDMSAHRNLCGATLGTGLGFGSMKDGTILIKKTGYPQITIWGRKFRDSIAEDYVSRRAVIREYEAASGKSGLDVYEISLLARSGDSAARHAFDELGRNLGVVVKDVLIENGFTAFLLGGAISKSADLLMPALLRELSDMPFMPEVRAVRDIDNAPLYGAAAMCLE